MITLLRPLRLKLGMLRPLRPKMTMLRFCAIEGNFCDFAGPKKNMLRLCATQTKYVATLRDPKKVCCDHHDSKWVCCKFVQPKYLREFARPKTDMLRLYATQKRYVPTVATQNGYDATLRDRNLCEPARLKISFLIFAELKNNILQFL